MRYRVNVILFVACFGLYVWTAATEGFSPVVNTVTDLIAGAGAGLFLASLIVVVWYRRQHEVVPGGASLTGQLNGADIIQDQD